MPIESIHRELIKIGKLLNYWQAELFASAWLAMFLGLLWLGGFSDLFLKWGPAGRIVLLAAHGRGVCLGGVACLEGARDPAHGGGGRGADREGVPAAR